MLPKSQVVIFWFRRDLRLEDNAGLYHALQSASPVLPIFIFDTSILEKLENKNDRRVDYIQQALHAINQGLKKYGSKLNTYLGRPLEIFQKMDEQFKIEAVYCNRDYEPQAIERDTDIYYFFTQRNIPFKAYKDQVIFDKDDIVKDDGTPYTVYTPYSRKWKKNLQPGNYRSYRSDFSNFYQQPFSEILCLKEIGFGKTDMLFEKPALD